MSPLLVHAYTLRAGAALNSASVRKEFPGALLKVGHGYTALHPWPEFGDAPLEVHLQALANEGSTPLLERALHCAAVDAVARKQGRSLFHGLHVPRSHYSWSMAQTVTSQLDTIERCGFSAVKLKGMQEHEQTAHLLIELHSVLPTLKLRVDFNACLNLEAVHHFLHSLPDAVMKQLDLVEDPCPYDAASWREIKERWGVRLALDKNWRSGTAGFDTVVVKPARRDWRTVAAIHPSAPLLLTSAMDHPLGQSYAAYEAALAWQQFGCSMELTGLCTQHLFEPDAFSARLGMALSTLQVDDSGTGLGFDAELADLPWMELRDFLKG